MAPAVVGRRGGLWRERDFALFWSGESISQFGTAITSVALPLVAVDRLHASTFIVAVLAAGTLMPWLVFGLLAGAWVDRLPRRPLLLVCDVVSMLAFASIPVAASGGWLSVGQLIAVALLAGSSAVFFSTALISYLPTLVEERDLVEGNAKLFGSRSAAQVSGPGLGGLLVQLAGAATTMLADAISFAVSFLCLISIRRPEPRRAAGGERRTRVRSEVGEGVRWVARDPLLRVAVIFAALANLFLTGFDALVIVFLVRTVHVGAGAVGLLLAAGSTGGVLGAILAGSLARRFGTARTEVVALMMGLPWALLAPLTGRGPALALFVISAFAVTAAITVGNVIGSSWQPTYVPPEMLGRVTACGLTAASR